MHRMQVRSLVRELRSHMPHSAAKGENSFLKKEIYLKSTWDLCLSRKVSKTGIVVVQEGGLSSASFSIHFLGEAAVIR